MSNRRASRARKKTIKARARKTNKRNRRCVVQTNETERNGAREDQLKLASLSSGVEVALLVSASIDWGKSVLISSRAASPSSVRSFVRRAAREPTGRNGTATDARGGRGANLTACRGGVRRTSSTSSTSTFGRSVGRRETARRFPAALRRSERLRTRREKRANGARELHVALGLPRRTRRGTGRARTRGGRETPSAQAIVRWNKFSSAPEGSKRAGLIAVLSSSQTAGRGGEARIRATRAWRRRNERMGSGRERARGRLLLGRGRRTEIMLQSAEKPTRRLVRLGRQSVSSLRARRRRSHCARVSDGRTEARFIRPRSIRSIPRRRQRKCAPHIRAGVADRRRARRRGRVAIIAARASRTIRYDRDAATKPVESASRGRGLRPPPIHRTNSVSRRARGRCALRASQPLLSN